MKNPCVVLVVDDDQDYRYIVQDSLRKCQVSTNGAEMILLERDSGVSALELVKYESVDLVITDLDMPHFDGCMLIHAIRNIQGLNRNVPIILLSGVISQQTTNDMENVYYLEKAFDLDGLNRLVSILISKRVE